MSSPLVHDRGCPSATGTQWACHHWCSAFHARVRPGPQGLAPLQWASLRPMRSGSISRRPRGCWASWTPRRRRRGVRHCASQGWVRPVSRQRNAHIRCFDPSGCRERRGWNSMRCMRRFSAVSPLSRLSSILEYARIGYFRS